jgi:elongation factor P--(R)-beta-lysine ligase
MGGEGESTWRRAAEGKISWETFRSRARIFERIREFFRRRGFLEVDPPILQPRPNIDPNVYPVSVADASGRRTSLFLHTSPEPSMKKLLAGGAGNIFYLGKVFRDREGSPLHTPEFTMLEWYRVGESAESVMRDVEELLLGLAREFAGGDSLRRGSVEAPLREPWPRWELSDAFRELLGSPVGDPAALRSALARKGLRPRDAEAWDDLFFRACLDVVEPALRERGAVFLTGFPASLAAMARRRPEDGDIAERFEGYVAGVELVNGYEELTDPVEQEARLSALAERHRRETGADLPPDGDFLDALRLGLPACSGASLGADRLVMLLLGKDAVQDVIFR